MNYIYTVDSRSEAFFRDNAEKLLFWIAIHLFLSKDYKVGLGQWLCYRPSLSNCSQWQSLTPLKERYIVEKVLLGCLIGT